MMNRRHWMRSATATAAATATACQVRAAASSQALIGITLDLEMARNFPKWETTHWDYEKGNLNDEAKNYSVAAAKRVKSSGGVLHFFAVGQVFEQPDATWLKGIVKAGHPVGNHTYDHINLTAAKPEDLQFRFQRAPWLLRGLTVPEVIRENIVMTNAAMKARLGITPAGFRTPGGFPNGLRDFPSVRAILKDVGFNWISSQYPPHPMSAPMTEPSAAVIDGIVAALPKAQPFVYENDGLVEVPMSPVSDINAFRNGRWRLDGFLRVIRQCLDWTIEHGAVFDFLAHPSCLYVVDPHMEAISLICETVRKAGDRAKIVDLGVLAQRAKMIGNP